MHQCEAGVLSCTCTSCQARKQALLLQHVKQCCIGFRSAEGCLSLMQVPRLHAILLKKLDPCSFVGPLSLVSAGSSAQQSRQQVLHLLCLAVGGDALAAEYLLLQLLAR